VDTEQDEEEGNWENEPWEATNAQICNDEHASSQYTIKMYPKFS